MFKIDHLLQPLRLRRKWYEGFPIKGKVISGAIWWTLVIIFTISLIDFLTYDLLPSNGFPEGRTLSRPLVIGGVLAYLGLMVRTVFSGKRADAVRSTLLVWALTVAMFLLIIDHLNGFALTAIFPILAATLFTISNISSIAPGSLSPFFKGISFLSLAVWSLFLPSIGAIDWPWQLIIFLFILFSSFGFMLIMPAYQNHEKPWVRVVARTAMDQTLSVGVMAFFILVLAYLLVFRSVLTDIAPDQLFLIDWGVISSLAIVTWAIYRYLRRKEVNERYRSHLFEIETRVLYGLGDMEPVVQSMRDFVELGNKEKLVVVMIRVLLERGLSEKEAAKVIQELVRYRDEPPTIWARWLIGDVRSSLEQRRCQAIHRALDILEEVLP